MVYCTTAIPSNKLHTDCALSSFVIVMAANVNSSKGPVGNQSRVDQYHNFLKNYADDSSTLTAEQKSAKLYDDWTTYEEVIHVT